MRWKKIEKEEWDRRKWRRKNEIKKKIEMEEDREGRTRLRR